MSKTITHEKALEIFRGIVKEKGSVLKAAISLDMSPSFLQNIMNGKAPISDNAAQKIGYRRVIQFEKVETTQE